MRNYSPSIVFLFETKCAAAVIKRIQRRTGLECGVWVDSIGKVGGLALIWSKEVDVSLRSMSARYIDVSIRHLSGEHWRFTGIYGWAEHGQKYNTWDLLKKLSRESEMAWIVGGDFNEILFSHEKKEGNPSDFASMKMFRDALDFSNLTDVKLKGYSFTWCNGRVEGLIEERLDRAVANSNWHDLFRNACTDTVVWDSSDHYPICISLDESLVADGHNKLRKKKMFRFEAK